MSRVSSAFLASMVILTVAVASYVSGCRFGSADRPAPIATDSAPSFMLDPVPIVIAPIDDQVTPVPEPRTFADLLTAKIVGLESQVAELKSELAECQAKQR